MKTQTNLALAALAYSFSSLSTITSAMPVGEETWNPNGGSGRGIGISQPPPVKIGQVNIGLLTYMPTVLESRPQLHPVAVPINLDNAGEVTFPPTDLVGAVISRTTHDPVKCNFYLDDGSTDESWFVDGTAKKTFLPRGGLEGVSRIACSLTSSVARGGLNAVDGSESGSRGIKPIDDFGVPNIVPTDPFQEANGLNEGAFDRETTNNNDNIISQDPNQDTPLPAANSPSVRY